MDPETPRALMQGFMSRVLAEEFGLAYDPSMRYRLKPLYDTQTMQTAGSMVEFFNTSTSTQAANTYGAGGASLREVGQIDDRTEILILGLSVEFVNQLAGAAADMADIAMLSEFGYLNRLWIGNNVVVDGPIPFNAMPANRGVSIPINGHAAALDFDTIANGAPGFGGLGLALPAFQRPYGIGGQELQAECGYAKTGGTSLTAAQAVRFSVHVIEVTSKGSGN